MKHMHQDWPLVPPKSKYGSLGNAADIILSLSLFADFVRYQVMPNARLLNLLFDRISHKPANDERRNTSVAFRGCIWGLSAREAVKPLVGFFLGVFLGLSLQFGGLNTSLSILLSYASFIGGKEYWVRTLAIVLNYIARKLALSISS